ncbi:MULTISPECIES: PilC/PilY family type IV pilus protein [unclassified Acinetobacter]|uniref:PilC/PilY family type IV pilus protein n=1 Tax=unclassified Acinetobacter TaxID=196816 RepID=UPI0015D3E3BF|nr:MULTISPECIES: PilC/PilY family type IV pilus protein [unclassified Acinetobacter]UUS61113.1 pilus assembly protein PilY [Acinetobacter sp. YH16056_T]
MKIVKKIASHNYEGKRSQLNLSLVATGAFFSTLLITSSVAQATDLQIYMAPTAGKKTIVMMLDTSGSMNYIKADYEVCSNSTSTSDKVITALNLANEDGKTYIAPSDTSPSYDRRFCYVSKSKTSSISQVIKDGCERVTDKTYRCYDRLTRLKDGMFAFLNSNNSTLNEVKVGLGNYSASGDGRSGQILVPAEKLDGVGSTHRTRLKNAIKDLTAKNGTPTAHAYAEAAAYLMGTKTGSVVALSEAPVFFTYVSYWDNYYKVCDTFDTAGKLCTSWSNGTRGTIPNFYINGLNQKDCNVDRISGKCYVKTGKHTANLDSGFNFSDRTTKIADSTAYNSPLPAVDDRQSCDGQGVYVLSDGAANSTNESRSINLMTNALGAKGTDFDCEGGLSEAFEGYNPGGWRCIGEFAKRLFDKNKNPAGISIQTAFVGFGSDMSDLTEPYVSNACKLSSRTQADRTSDDACSPGKATYGVENPGYGNGGFFIANDPAEVTRSVVQFIDNIGKNPIDPLSTGAISVPVDALSPHTFQPYGYLRALEPKPGTLNMIWMGNLKKYPVSGGALKSKDESKWVYESDGSFTKGTQDIWNDTSKTDDAGVDIGGVISKLKLPTEAAPNGYRPLYSDIGSVSSTGVITTTSKGSGLFYVSQSTTTPNDLLSNFENNSKLKNLSTDIKLKLLNYFGFNLPLTPSEMPKELKAPELATSAMGASIHSFPVQMTYSGDLDSNGDLGTVRKQSVLYGSMEGALRIVDGTSGIEQMVFVPSEILSDSTASKALVKGESDQNGATAGIGGAWIVDSKYNIVSETDESVTVNASKMNVYGGMRMGGRSYYGLDVLKPTDPKFLFKVTGGSGEYARMGQTWSKPVLANIRYKGKITRVMIVGGGYDACYENPQFILGKENPDEFQIKNHAGTVVDNCKKSEALGNAVYIIHAETGERIWWASNTGANTNNTAMKHSVVSRISTLDRDGDGLIDNLYFGDLGGQVFRVDLNNAANAQLGKRVIRLADLSVGKDVNQHTLTAGNQPRFYQPPTLTIHDEGKDTFLLLGIASGDRSTPLDVAPTEGREKIKPFNALTNRPTNKVYGLIDRDVANSYLITGKLDGTDIDLTKDITLEKLYPNPQTISGKVASQFAIGGKLGWYRSLSSGPDGKEILTAVLSDTDGKTVSTTRTPGGLKAFEEEPAAITGRLMVPVYDPQGTGIVDRSNPCQPRVVGETHVQQFCLPYGACLNSTGNVDTTKDKVTGFQMLNGRNQNVLGAGIRGISMGPDNNADAEPLKGANCGALTILGLQSGKGRWECNKILNPTRWYEKYVEAKNN